MCWLYLFSLQTSLWYVRGAHYTMDFDGQFSKVRLFFFKANNEPHFDFWSFRQPSLMPKHYSALLLNFNEQASQAANLYSTWKIFDKYICLKMTKLGESFKYEAILFYHLMTEKKLFPAKCTIRLQNCLQIETSVYCKIITKN